MILQAIDAVVELAKRAHAGEVVQSNVAPGQMVLLRKPDGSAEYRVAPAGPRRHSVASLDGVLSALDGLSEAAKYTRVYVGPSTVTVSLVEDGVDHPDNGRLTEETIQGIRQHTATWTIPWSARLTLLEAQERKERERWNPNRKGADDQAGPLEALRQQAMVDLLSTVFGGDRVSITPGDLLPTLRSIKFKSATDGTSTVNPGRSSIAAEVVEQTIGSDREIPDRCTLRFAPIDGTVLPASHGEPLASVGCAVIVRPETKQMGLIPDPGACAAARRMAIDVIGSAIAAHVESRAELKGVRVIVGADFH